MTAHHSRRRIIPLVTLMAALFVSGGAAAGTGALTVTFTGNTITVQGVSSGGELVLLGAGMGREGASALVTSEFQRLEDDDGDGTVTHTSRYVPGHSVWIAVDVRSGASAAVTPRGTAPVPLAVGPEVWTAGRTSIDLPRSYLTALYVRPGVGAWRTGVTDGGPADSDGIMNGVIRLRPDAMHGLAGTADAPTALNARDIAVLVDPHTLETIVAEVR